MFGDGWLATLRTNGHKTAVFIPRACARDIKIAVLFTRYKTLVLFSGIGSSFKATL